MGTNGVFKAIFGPLLALMTAIIVAIKKIVVAAKKEEKAATKGATSTGSSLANNNSSSNNINISNSSHNKNTGENQDNFDLDVRPDQASDDAELATLVPAPESEQFGVATEKYADTDTDSEQSDDEMIPTTSDGSRHSDTASVLAETASPSAGDAHDETPSDENQQQLSAGDAHDEEHSDENQQLLPDLREEIRMRAKAHSKAVAGQLARDRGFGDGTAAMAEALGAAAFDYVYNSAQEDVPVEEVKGGLIAALAGTQAGVELAVSNLPEDDPIHGRLSSYVGRAAIGTSPTVKAIKDDDHKHTDCSVTDLDTEGANAGWEIV